MEMTYLGIKATITDLGDGTFSHRLDVLPTYKNPAYHGYSVAAHVEAHDGTEQTMRLYIEAGMPAAREGNRHDRNALHKMRIYVATGAWYPSVLDVAFNQKMMDQIKVGGVWVAPIAFAVAEKKSDTQVDLFMMPRSELPPGAGFDQEYKRAQGVFNQIVSTMEMTTYKATVVEGRR